MTRDEAGDVLTAGPYLGLTFYTEAETEMFFGRDGERKVLISNLRAARLTLLYAQSGTGKSSLLRAGVSARLRALAERSAAAHRPPGNVPVVFSSWREAEPTDRLITEIEQSVRPFIAPEVRVRRRTVAETVKAAGDAAGASLLVILDQFEEYLLGSPSERSHHRFAGELADCVNAGDGRGNFLIAVREDAYSRVGDLLQARIDNVYGNYLHLENLSAAAGREAIVRPVRRFNELHPDLPDVEVETALVDRVLSELGGDLFGVNGAEPGPNGSPAGHHTPEIPPPYLQLVMKRVWQAEMKDGSLVLREQTLEGLGGSKTIVTTHVDRQLQGFEPAEREMARDVFHHLVTPSGTKLALSASDLAEYTGHAPDDVERLLTRLIEGDSRILRPVPAPAGSDGATRYEISHDLLAPAILDWRTRQLSVRLEQEQLRAADQERLASERGREVARQAAVARHRAIVIAVLAVGFVAIAIAGAIFGWFSNSRQVSVPDLRHTTSVYAAEKLLVGAGLTLSSHVTTMEQSSLAPGAIVHQSPAGGTKVKTGTPVDVVVAVGSGRVVVPSVTGLSVAGASMRLRAGRLALGVVSPQPVNVRGRIASQIPIAGTTVAPGFPIEVFLPPPIAPVKVPAVADDPQAAMAQLSQDGLVPVLALTPSTAPMGFVVGTRPAARAVVSGGQTVSVLVATPPDVAYDDGHFVHLVSQDGKPVQGAVPASQNGQSEPSFSYDGRSLVYVQDQRLMLLNIEHAGGRPVPLTNAAASDFAPAFAPRAQAEILAYTQYGRGYNGALCLGRLQGRLTSSSCTSHPGWPLFGRIFWSPDGRRILALAGEHGRTTTFGLIEFDSNVPFSTKAADWGRGRVVTTTSQRDHGVIVAAFSPDGKKLAVVSDIHTSGFALYLASSDDLRLKHARRLRTNVCDASWRSDGKALAVVIADGDCSPPSGRIATLKLGHPATVTTLVDARNAEDPAWQPALPQH